MSDPKQSSAYQLYVNDTGEDMVGMIAYGLYKSGKRAFFSDYVEQNGKPPSADEINGYHLAMCTEGVIAGNIARATDMYNTVYQEQLAKIVDEKVQSIQKNAIMTQLDVIKGGIEAKTTFKGWVAGVGEALVVNFLTILVIAALVFGYVSLKKINSGVDAATGLDAQHEDTPKSQPTSQKQPQPARPTSVN